MPYKRPVTYGYIHHCPINFFQLLLFKDYFLFILSKSNTENIDAMIEFGGVSAVQIRTNKYTQNDEI